MPKPNKHFELDIDDICLIEESLTQLQRNCLEESETKQIETLKAKIFHQKNWYRPKGQYISG